MQLRRCKNIVQLPAPAQPHRLMPPDNAVLPRVWTLCLGNTEAGLGKPYLLKQTSSLKSICMQLKCDLSVSFKLELPSLVEAGSLHWWVDTGSRWASHTLPTNINFSHSALKQNIAIQSWVILRSSNVLITGVPCWGLSPLSWGEGI